MSSIIEKLKDCMNYFKEITNNLLDFIKHIKSLYNSYHWVTGEKLLDPNVFKRGYLHFKTITTHKYLVTKSCFKVGLYYQGIMHDLSKYSPVEFIPSTLFYQYGHRSPNNEERERMGGVTKSWLHHKGCNKHHYEYWQDYSTPPKHDFGPVKMDDKYIVEMFLDRVAASKVYQGRKYTKESAWNYFDKSPVRSWMHPYTVKVLEHLLRMLCVYDEEATFAYLKSAIKNGYNWEFGKENIYG